MSTKKTSSRASSTSSSASTTSSRAYSSVIYSFASAPASFFHVLFTTGCNESCLLSIPDNKAVFRRTPVSHLGSRRAGDNRSIPGMDRVDELAEYLVELREQTGLTLNNQQVSTILGLWQSLDKFNKDTIVYAARHQDRLLTGRFRSPKKKAVFTPGDYKKIRQLVLCNGTLMQQTTLQLVVNQTTLMQWYNQWLKGQEVSVLLQVPTPATSLPAAHIPYASKYNWTGKT
ncbi:hypothetical protein D4764_22G0007470 [Takifugu flavidus]|uniref:Uncharacterized protein n=1 Tax=Takifugu flavidus TaxID=433684 RepID=A0A5C6NGG5_9TELE|nr:hypothetical protein D4764_22G0007470 [Takifugu flavidus]